MKNKELAANEDYDAGSTQEANNQWDMSGIEWGGETISSGSGNTESAIADADEIPSDEAELPVDSAREPEKELTLEEIRQRHVEYLKGTYAPTQEEWLRILKDDDFYDSNEYLTFRKQELDEFAHEHDEIYAPTYEKISRATKPFIDLVQSDIDGLLEAGDDLEKGALTENNIYKVVDFFAEKFGITDVPDLELIYDTANDNVDDGRITLGAYNSSLNKMSIMVDKINSIAELIDTSAHEMWHAHQHHHGDNNKNYEVNFANYYSSSMDYDAYRCQLVEMEAFTVGKAVGDMYRKAILARDHRRMIELNDKYHDWMDGEYDPYESNDGIDSKYLVMAHKKYVEYNKLSNVLKRFFRREKK